MLFKLSRNLILIKSIFLFGNIFCLNLNSNAQTNNSLQTGSTNSLKISLTNTIGVTTTANTTDNLIVENEAVLNLKENSKIQDSFGEGDSEAENMSVSFDVSPNGSNVGISGLKASNEYIIDKGTRFRSSMVSEAGNTEKLNGTASAGLYHDMTLQVEQTNSSFTSAFSQSF